MSGDLSMLPTRARNVWLRLTDDERRMHPRLMAGTVLNCGLRTAYQIAGYLRWLEAT